MNRYLKEASRALSSLALLAGAQLADAAPR